MFKKVIQLLLVLQSGLLWTNTAVSAEHQIGILVFDTVLTSDIVAPAEVFGVASRKSWFSDYEVIFVGVDQKDSITTEEGIEIKVDATIHDTLDLDVLIVNSAYDMQHLFDNKALTQFLLDQSAKVSWLVSNCSGAFLYAHAGLYDGYRATTYAGGEKKLQRGFPKISVVHDTNVVVDRNRISTNGGIPSYQGALVLLSMMSNPNRAQSVYETIQLNRLIPWTDISKYLPASPE